MSIYKPAYNDVRLVIVMLWLPWIVIETLHRKRKLLDLRADYVNAHTVKTQARFAAAAALGAKEGDRSLMSKKTNEVVQRDHAAVLSHSSHFPPFSRFAKNLLMPLKACDSIGATCAPSASNS